VPGLLPIHSYQLDLASDAGRWLDSQHFLLFVADLAKQIRGPFSRPTFHKWLGVQRIDGPTMGGQYFSLRGGNPSAGRPGPLDRLALEPGNRTAGG
jgi:hypothetical protein